MLHLTALCLMAATEIGIVAKTVFVLVWAFLNCFWLTISRRPTVAAIVSLSSIVALILLSQFKYDKLWLTADFMDVMIIDHDTSAFLLATFPALRVPMAAAALTIGIIAAIACRIDRVRISTWISSVGGLLCFGSLVALSLAEPTRLHEDFLGQNYVSKFARTGVEATYELATHGI